MGASLQQGILDAQLARQQMAGAGRQGPELLAGSYAEQPSAPGSVVGSVPLHHQQPQPLQGQQQYTHMSRAAVNGMQQQQAQGQGPGLGLPPPHATMTGGELHI